MIRRVTLAWQSRGLLVVGKLMKDTIVRVAGGTAVLLAAAGLAAGTATYPALAAGQGRASMAQPTRASSPSWQVVKKVPGEDFSAVVATGPNGGWAFGSGTPGADPRPTAWRRSGSSWTRVSFPGQREEVVITAAATSASDVWAFTTGGARSRALHWNGRAWTVARAFGLPIGGAAVISPGDVWVFGQAAPVSPVGFGAWHFDGRTWSHVASGHGLGGGSGRSARDVWSFGGTDVAHWNGSSWSRTSVARLLPAALKSHLNDPAVTGVFEQSADSVYATGNGNDEDDGGPMVLLHWNGHRWSKVAGGLFGFGVEGVQPIAPDGRGGLWIPMAGPEGGLNGRMLHYSGGHLTTVAIPGGPSRTSTATVAGIPGTSEALAGGFTHAAGNAGLDDAGVLLEYES